MRRGFKTEAELTAEEFRAELSLGRNDPLDPWELAAHLEVPVLPLMEFNVEIPAEVNYLRCVEKTVFSALTVIDGFRRIIVYNDAHLPNRQRSSIAHELAHAILHHPPTPALNNIGCRLWNKDIEDEADWLAGALLIPAKAALALARSGAPTSRGAEMFQVSAAMVNFRINKTGARKRAEREGKLKKGAAKAKSRRGK